MLSILPYSVFNEKLERKYLKGRLGSFNPTLLRV